MRTYGLDDSSIYRHKHAGHVAEALALYEAELQPFRIDTTKIFHRNVAVLGKALEAADRWLTDPDDPESYTLDSRGNEVDVVYLDYQDCKPNGEPRRKRDTLQGLLRRVEAPGTVGVVQVREKFADPREYLLKTAEQLRGELTLFMQALGVAEAVEAKRRAEQREKAEEEVATAALFELKLGGGVLEEMIVRRTLEAVPEADEAQVRSLAAKIAPGLIADAAEAFCDETGGV